VAILDLRPLRPGHALVLPRAHAARLDALPAATRAHLLETGLRVAAAQRAAGLADDVHLAVNDGPAAAQTVPHAHLHVVPRRRGDGPRFLARLLAVPIAPALPATPRARLDALADVIRGAMPR
jgi:histidine triad (HIT) family protein